MDTTTAPSTFVDLVTQLRARRDTFSPSHRKLAEQVLTDPESVAFMTVAELAAAAGVNQATVVRFASSLGLDGYPGLNRLCREWLRRQAQLLRRFDDLEQLADTDMLPRMLAHDQANLSRTFSRIAEEHWSAAVRHLAEAPRVHVIGQRKSHAPAYLLAYLLGMVREEVHLVTSAAGLLTDEMRSVRAGDCFVAMAIRRYSADTVRAARWARATGAQVVALTDNAASPLVDHADEVFYVEAASPSVLRSMTAFTALVQALVADVARRHGRVARAQLLQEEHLLDNFGVYAGDTGGTDPIAE